MESDEIQRKIDRNEPIEIPDGYDSLFIYKGNLNKPSVGSNDPILDQDVATRKRPLHAPTVPTSNVKFRWRRFLRWSAESSLPH